LVAQLTFKVSDYSAVLLHAV